MRTRHQWRCFAARACAGTAVIALEEPQPESGLGMPVAFEIVRSRSRQLRTCINADLTASRGSQQARRQMMEDVMANVIEFYVSDSLPGKSNYIARKESRKLIEFRVPKRNQANSNSAQWSGMCMAYVAPFAATLRAVEPTTPCEHSGKRGGDPDEEPR
jgi:hypothetical protein